MLNNMDKKDTQRRKKGATTSLLRGFTIIESLVAISILTITLAAFTSLIISDIKLLRESKDRQRAFKIAQEGMELAINKKENNVLCSLDDSCLPRLNSWQENLIGDFEVDAFDTRLLLHTRQFREFDPTHYLCSLSGRFTYHCNRQGSVPLYGNYTREIIVTAPTRDNILVQATVRWQKTNSVILETVLYNK